MDVDIDHYTVLGLPSGEDGANLSDNKISKAYKLKALELHPDKRPNDPNAHENFQRLKSSYEILKNEKARKVFDDMLRVKRAPRDLKRQQMIADLEQRERAAFAKTRKEKEDKIIARKLRIRKLWEEIARIRANKSVPAWSLPKRDVPVMGTKSAENGKDYSLEKLMELFFRFGKIKFVHGSIFNPQHTHHPVNESSTRSAGPG